MNTQNKNIPEQDQRNRESTMKSICFKIILIGQSSTGKTSMIRSYIHGKFLKDYQVTVGVDFSSKTVKVETAFVQLQIWDTVKIIDIKCGQDVYQSITKSFYRGASAVFLVYSVNSRQSFEKAAVWLQKFRQQGSTLAFLFLIGTKVDLSRQVQQQEALEFMKANQGAFFIQTSALTGQNISKLFQKAAQIMYKCYQVNPQFQKFVNPRNQSNFTLNRKTTAFYPSHQISHKKRNCCQ